MIFFISCLEQLAAQLRDAGATVDEAQITAKILVSLQPSFRSFSLAWESSPQNEKTLLALTKRLVKEEKTNKLYNSGKVDPLEIAFLADGS